MPSSVTMKNASSSRRPPSAKSSFSFKSARYPHFPEPVMRYSFLLLALLLNGPVAAAGPSDRPPDLKPVPDGPPGPDDAPQVTIKPSSQGRVVEYRANGKLYMLKVIPKVGKPYYLIDQKLDGRSRCIAGSRALELAVQHADKLCRDLRTEVGREQ